MIYGVYILNKRQAQHDKGQARSYAKLLDARAIVLVAKEGIWIGEQYDDYDECFTPISESSGVNLIGDLSKYSLLYILNVINEYSDRLTK